MIKLGPNTEDQLYNSPELREIMVLSGRNMDQLGVRLEGQEVMGQMELLDVKSKEFVSLMPNQKVPKGGPYVPSNHLPTKYYEYLKKRK